MKHPAVRRWASALAITTMVGGVLSLMVVRPASALHGEVTVEVYREFSSTTTTAITLTARVQNSDGTAPSGLAANAVEVDWEIENVAADGEGGAATYSTPDRTCRDATAPDAAAPYYECSVTIASGGATGVGTVRAWIDHDLDGGVVEADQAEGRLSSADTDCATERPVPAGTHPVTANADAYDECHDARTEQPGDPLAAEPDATDVVQIAFTVAAPAARLDCPETTTAPAGATGTVLCRVTDASGRPLSGYHVDGELYGASDAKAAPADYNGGDTAAQCVSGGDGVCPVRMPAANANEGSAEVCFWIDLDHGADDDFILIGNPSFGSGAGDGGECAGEAVAGAADGTANATDRVTVTRQARARTAVDLDPESGKRVIGQTQTVTATVLDQFGDPWAAATVVRFELLAGSVQDGDGSTPGLADRTCTTPGSGATPASCTFAYSSPSAGTDTICGWIGATPSAACDGEVQNVDSRRNVDLIVERWVAPGTTAATTTTSPPAPPGPAKAQGYTLVGADGGIFNFGASAFHGSTGDMELNQPVIGMANKKGGTGYWLVASDGGIFSFGDAAFFGSTGDRTLNAPILGMEATPTGLGYWLFAADGGIFTFGDAVFRGSTGDMRLNAPVVGMAVTAKGDGYWLVARDGGIFTFNAPFHGSTGNRRLNEPVFDMGARPGDAGYWLVARDGGIFSFGDAVDHFAGSAVGATSAPVIGLGVTPTGSGYWIADARGAVFGFGDAGFLGDRRNEATNAATVGFATVPAA